MNVSAVRLCGFVALIVGSAPPALAQPVAVGDYLLTVEGIELAFSEADLLANDQHGPSAVVAIESPPQAGKVTCFAGACTYEPETLFAGEDRFTYRVVEAAGFSAPATVTIRVTPAAVPLAGDWDGDGTVDLGWFHSRCQDLYFASFTLYPEAIAQPTRSHPPLPDGSLGWIPFAGDWDGDKRADVGVFDPRARTFYLYLQDPASPYAPGSPPLWLAVAHFQGPDSGQGVLPLAGDWDGDGQDQVGMFHAAEVQFLLLAPGGAVTHDFLFEAPHTGDWLPVAAEWGGDGAGAATVGVYSPALRQLLVRRQNTAGPAHAALVLPDEPQRNLPIAGHWAIGESIGFYLPPEEEPGPGEEPFGSFALYPYAFLPGDPLGGTRIVLPPPPDPWGDLCPLP
jgi:hypothetical protein